MSEIVVRIIKNKEKVIKEMEIKLKVDIVFDYDNNVGIISGYKFDIDDFFCRLLFIL